MPGTLPSNPTAIRSRAAASSDPYSWLNIAAVVLSRCADTRCSASSRVLRPKLVRVVEASEELGQNQSLVFGNADRVVAHDSVRPGRSAGQQNALQRRRRRNNGGLGVALGRIDHRINADAAPGESK